MSRLAIFNARPSDSVNELRTEISRQNQTLIKIRTTGSQFRGRADDFIINYGSSEIPVDVMGGATILNRPNAIANSSKLVALQKMKEAGCQVVPFTDDRQIAQGWLDAGMVVYARQQLRAHSGEGIVVCSAANLAHAGNVTVQPELAQAPLYTLGTTAERREFRVHVVRGRVLFISQKRRRDGYREDPNYSNIVRNHGNGWIYATENVDLNNQVKNDCIRAVKALGLDFGAVDVITRRDDHFILEVNTAPGMTGTTTERYAQAFIDIYRGNLDAVPTTALPTAEIATNVANYQAALTRAFFIDPLLRPVTANATARPVPPQPAQQPQATIDVTATPVPTAPQAAPVQQQQPAAPTHTTVARVDRGFYWVNLGGRNGRTIGQYNQSTASMQLIGWDIPIPVADLVIGALITE